MGNYLDIIGHRTSIQLKIEKKKQQAPNNKQLLAPHGWLVLSFLQPKKQLPFVASCTHWSPPRRACQRILPLPRRSLSLRRQRPGLTYQSPKVGPNHAASTNPRWDQDECEKRIKQNSLTSTWFNLMEVLFTKTSSQFEFASNFGAELLPRIL